MQGWKRNGLGLGLALVLCSVVYVVAQGAFHPRTDIYVFENGFRVGPERLNGMNRTAATELSVGGTDVATLTSIAGAGSVVQTAIGSRVTMPATEVIASTGTITADACGGIKRISSASAVTTGTTHTITAPSAALAGCVMVLLNVNASDAITLDANANMKLVSGANVALAANSSIVVGCDGTAWRQLSAQLTAT